MTRDPRPSGAVRRAFVLVGRATRLPGKFFRTIGGESILGRELRILSDAGLEVGVASVAPFGIPDVPVIADPYDAGPLGGLLSILSSTDPPFFLFGADMPFLDPEGIRVLGRAYDGRTVVPLSADGSWQVLHAIYAKTRRDETRRLLERGAGLLDLVRALDGRGAVKFLRAGRIPERSFVDIDTPAQYERWSRRARPPGSSDPGGRGRGARALRPPASDSSVPPLPSRRS